MDIIPDSLRVKNVRPNTSLGEKSITFSNVSDAIKSSVKMIEKELMYVDKTTSDYIDEADTNGKRILVVLILKSLMIILINKPSCIINNKKLKLKFKSQTG